MKLIHILICLIVYSFSQEETPEPSIDYLLDDEININYMLEDEKQIVEPLLFNGKYYSGFSGR